jgi:predicted RNA methylase
LKVTVDVTRNSVPLMASVCAAEPAARDDGDSDVTAGTGLLAETAKLTGADEPPPGVGLVTTTG